MSNCIRILKVACFAFFLAAQIMELHKKIKPLEEEISFLKEENAENLKGKEENVTVTLCHEMMHTQILYFIDVQIIFRASKETGFVKEATARQ